MVTIKEFKEWLGRFPEDTIIEVGIQEPHRNYESYGAVNFQALKLSDCDFGDGWEFVDFRNNKFVTESSPSFGKCYLKLGESC